MESLTSKMMESVAPAKIREPELVSAKTLSAMFDVKVTTIWEWVAQARKKPSAESIPYIQIPGSRILRFPLKKVREWYGRGTRG